MGLSLFIFCTKMNIPAVSPGHQCGFVLRIQRCFDPALDNIHIYIPEERPRRTECRIFT